MWVASKYSCQKIMFIVDGTSVLLATKRVLLKPMYALLLSVYFNLLIATKMVKYVKQSYRLRPISKKLSKSFFYYFFKFKNWTRSKSFDACSFEL